MEVALIIVAAVLYVGFLFWASLKGYYGVMTAAAVVGLLALAWVFGGKSAALAMAGVIVAWFIIRHLRYGRLGPDDG